MIKTSLSRLSGHRSTADLGLTLADILRRQARLIPDNTAVVHKGVSLTYYHVNRLTDLLALELIRRGVQRGDRVGVMADRSELAPLSILGIMKAGAAYVPLNPGHPRFRIMQMIEDAGIEYVIIDGSLKTSISDFGGTFIDARLILNSPAETAETLPALSAEDLMAVVYTSGTTGTPKGVMLTHKNSMVFPGHYKNITRLSKDDAVASFVSLSFIMHTTDIFPTFMAGAALHIIADDIRLDTSMVNRYFEQNHITVVILPFSFGHKFTVQEKNHSLRSMTMAGENFVPLPDLTPGYTIYNAYGCTECCSGVAMGEIHPGDTSITVGGPVDNADIYILDEQSRLAAWGEKGELCTAGPAVSTGYLNQSDKTTSVFMKNPFNDEIGYERLYKTGDVARITEDGEIVIMGRVDFQIKINGYRIEPGEIDACIRRYPGVLESVTVAAESARGRKLLVSYVAADKKLVPGDLRTFISDFLPPYMVPRFIEQIEKLPRNMNGKIDRAKLPDPLPLAGDTHITLETETEKKLACLWAFVLDLQADKINREADFFELGGDSLRAMALTIEIGKAFFGTDLSPAEIFQTPLFREQARILSKPGNFKAIHIYSSRNDKKPIFFVHGGNIGPEAYLPLVQKLPEDQSFYCLENYNIYHSDSRISGLVPLAEKYIEFMQELVPQGPFVLGGWSFGGLVAFEMARQLEAAGERVDHLYLLDPRLVYTDEERQLQEQLPKTYYRDYLARDPLFERFRNLGLLEILIDNNREVTRDIQTYIPASGYGGETTLFKAGRPDPIDPGAPPEILEILRRLQAIASESQDNGFGGYVPKLGIIEVPEIHDGFMQGEALEIIASVINSGQHRPKPDRGV